MTHTGTMITRQALLIYAGTDKGRAVRLPAELEATRHFLLSPSGGAWQEEELLILGQPTQKSLLRAVSELHADYTITCFFGKSFPGSQDRHFLVLSDQDFIEDTDLLNGSERQLVLVDASGNQEPVSYNNTTYKPSEYEKSRSMYNKWIQASEPGKMIMHGSEQATVTTEGKSAGLFMRKLLQVAHSVPAASNRFHLKSILAAGHETPDLLLEEGYEAGPAITWSEGNIRLPFALALPLPVPALPAAPAPPLD